MALAKEPIVVVWFVFWVGWLLQGTRVALLRVGSRQGFFAAHWSAQDF
jgi:hypothetical protein